MYEDKMDNPWYQKMALIETLTDDEKIQLYHREYPMILKCSKIPRVILQTVVSKDGTVMEQLHLLRNKFIGKDVIKTILQNTKYDYVREDAEKRLHEREKQRAQQICQDLLG